MTHIVIVGTSHPLQCGHSSVSPENIGSFEAEVRLLLQKHQIVRITEEMDADGLARHKVTETIAERVAKELGLEHQHLDLTRCERTALGLHDGPLFTIIDLYNPSDSGKSFRDALSILEAEIRERIWVHRILATKSSPVLFICGASHVEPLARLWKLLGMPCDVAHYDYSA